MDQDRREFEHHLDLYPSWRWSISELMIATALVAGFLAIFAYIGYPNVFLILCCIAAALQTTTYSIALPRARYAAPRSVSAILVFVSMGCFLFVSFVTLINCLLHLFWSTFSSKTNPPTHKQAVCISCLLTLIAFAIGTMHGYSEYLELLEARKRFAPQDLSGRMVYEKLPISTHSAQLTDTSRVAKDWDQFESVYEDELQTGLLDRNWHLKLLHRKSVESFIKSPGFGVGRMYLPRFDQKDLASTQKNVPVESMSDVVIVNRYAGDVDFDRVNGWSRPESTLGFKMDQRGFHFQRTYDFLWPTALGVPTDDGNWIGNEPHAIRWPAEFIDETPETSLSLTQLQLVSLLRFDEPRVYLLDHMPRMDELARADVKTRELNDFESAALTQLQTGTAFVSESAENVVRAMGSVVTLESCQRCHSTKKFEMLGAFSYEFERVEKINDK